MNSDFQALCHNILAAGRHRYGAMMGIVSCVQADRYQVVAVSSDTAIPCPGDVYPLNSVYCREVVEKDTTVALTRIDDVLGMSLHPLYDAIPCEFYISSPIHRAGQVWGTLNFTSLDKRATPFSAADIAFNEENAAAIARALGEAETPEPVAQG